MSFEGAQEEGAAFLCELDLLEAMCECRAVKVLDERSGAFEEAELQLGEVLASVVRRGARAEPMCMHPSVCLDDGLVEEKAQVVLSKYWSMQSVPDTRASQDACREMITAWEQARCVLQFPSPEEARTAFRTFGRMAERMLLSLHLQTPQREMAMRPPWPARTDEDDLGPFRLGGWLLRAATDFVRADAGLEPLFHLHWAELHGPDEEGFMSIRCWTSHREEACLAHEVHFRREGVRAAGHNLVKTGDAHGEEWWAQRRDTTMSFRCAEEAGLWHEVIEAAFEGRDLGDLAARLQFIEGRVLSMQQDPCAPVEPYLARAQAGRRGQAPSVDPLNEQKEMRGELYRMVHGDKEPSRLEATVDTQGSGTVLESSSNLSGTVIMEP